MAKVENADNPLFQPREVNHLGVVVVTADRGLCGSFNTNLIKQALFEIHENIDKESFLINIGRKGYDFLKKRNYNITDFYINIFNSLEFALVPKIVDSIIQTYINGKVDKVIVIFNEFKSAVQQNIVVEQFLPILPEDFDESEATGYDYIFEPDKQQLLESLLPRHLNMQMWKILLESNAAEQGARMTAMENATENANEMIRGLTLKYNRARQSSITTELSEIVGGAEALKG